MTPMQEQYEQMKKEYPSTVLLFRLGDFYEAFNDDAVTISKTLGITLTGRGKGEVRRPMAGIPHHALKNYLPKLITAGLKVAIADQMEEPIPGKLVERKITKVITPGTMMEENVLDNSNNNYIVSVFIGENKIKQTFALVFCDISTGELRAFETDSPRRAKAELEKYKPNEVLCSTSQVGKIKNVYKEGLEQLDEYLYGYEKSYETVTGQLGVLNLKGFGLEDKKFIIQAAGALIAYLKDCQKTDLKHIKTIRLYTYDDYMQLDPETIRNLELLYPMSGYDQSVTVYNALNQCKNPMGKRMLRQWLLMPLKNPEILEERLDSVEYFFDSPIQTSEIQKFLNETNDIERIVGRIGVASANPKDIVALRFSLENTLEAMKIFINDRDKLPKRLLSLIGRVVDEGNMEQKLLGNLEDESTAEHISTMMRRLIELIESSISDDPPTVFNEGGIIREGYNKEVDELRELAYGSKKILAQIQEREVKSTGINTLKISYNQVFGYYIEVTKSHLSKVPSHYIRKQTLVNAERYITEELKELEGSILSAEEKLKVLERDLFVGLRNDISQYSTLLLELGKILAEIDVLSNFGQISRQNRYSKPRILNSDEDATRLEIKDGRHVVVEKLTQNFVPNNTEFVDSSFIHILTGPNMSGKSTYIRQVALITLLAQIGCFVPATDMEFHLVDRIFTRVGASDNLAHGESTFMVEMTETANILNNATKNSLVILDEVGRGTSTYDGVAIAWSIIEYLYSKIGCKTLFATHYHELIDMEENHKGVVNYNVKVLEDKGEILFQHKIEKGSTNRSYGVHVAKLAGVPDIVVEKAEEILRKFEGESELNEKIVGGNQRTSARVKKTPNKSYSGPKKIHPEQIGLL